MPPPLNWMMGAILMSLATLLVGLISVTLAMIVLGTLGLLIFVPWFYWEFRSRERDPPWKRR